MTRGVAGDLITGKKDLCFYLFQGGGLSLNWGDPPSRLPPVIRTMARGIGKGRRDGVGQTIFEAWGGAAVFLLLKYYV